MLLYIIGGTILTNTWYMPALFEIIAGLGFMIVTIVAGVGWFVGLFGALTGKYYKLPVAGDLAERWVKPQFHENVK